MHTGEHQQHDDQQDLAVHAAVPVDQERSEHRQHGDHRHHEPVLHEIAADEADVEEPHRHDHQRLRHSRDREELAPQSAESTDQQERGVRHEEGDQVEDAEHERHDRVARRLREERVGEQLAVVRELPHDPRQHQHRGRQTDLHRSSEHRGPTGGVRRGVIIGGGGRIGRPDRRCAALQTPGHDEMDQDPGTDQHHGIQTCEHGQTRAHAGSDPPQRAVPGGGRHRQQQRTDGHHEQRLLHRLEPAGGVGQEGDVRNQRHRHQEREPLVAEQTSGEPQRHRDRRENQRDADDLTEDRRGPPELLGDPVHQGPQEVRVPLDLLALVEDQAVAASQVPGVAVRDERIVLDEADHPGGERHDDVQRHLGQHPAALDDVIDRVGQSSFRGVRDRRPTIARLVLDRRTCTLCPRRRPRHHRVMVRSAGAA